MKKNNQIESNIEIIQSIPKPFLTNQSGSENIDKSQSSNSQADFNNYNNFQKNNLLVLQNMSIIQADKNDLSPLKKLREKHNKFREREKSLSVQSSQNSNVSPL